MNRTIILALGTALCAAALAPAALQAQTKAPATPAASAPTSRRRGNISVSGPGQKACISWSANGAISRAK